jgi:homopolymeric O-antigen transport system ATP-binding protein
MSSTAAISARGLEKSYRLYERPADRLLELLLRRRRHRVFTALSDVSFELPRGGSLGLVGENGAGKSTLLKVVAGTTTPTRGEIQRSGAVASILELGMGFHPEFSGRDNARLNAALLGLSASEVRRRMPAIRDFSELGDFFDRPVKTYSSGMSLRLAFSVATHVDAEILVIDEALAVGDGYFQKKSIDRIVEFQRRGGTLLFCSHALYYVGMLCREAIWLHEGHARAQGPALPVIRKYEAYLQDKERRLLGAPEEPAAAPGVARRPAWITSVVVHDGSGAARSTFASGETLAVDVAFETADPALAFQVRIGIDREDGTQVTAVDTRRAPWAPLSGSRRYTVRATFPDMPIAQGEFRLYVYLGDEHALHLHDARIVPGAFSYSAAEYVVGLLRPPCAWTLVSEADRKPVELEAPAGQPAP